jgi:hypothetical protein
VKDKATKKQTLALLRNQTLYNKGVVDQWGMVRVRLFVIRDLKPET